MAIHYKNPQTGEYEVIKIPVVRGEQGHAGIHVGSEAPPTTDIKLWFDPSDTSNEADLANRLDTTLEACYDYMGNDQGSIKGAADANVEYLLREVNTTHHEGTSITATDTYQKQVNHVLLKGMTKYRDKATGEIIDSFQEGENLELVSVKSPVLTTVNSNIFPFEEYIKGTRATEDEDYIYVDGAFDEFTIPLETDRNIYTIYIDGEVTKNDNFGEWTFLYEDGTVSGTYLYPEFKSYDTKKPQKIVGVRLRNPFSAIFKLKKTSLCFNLKSIGYEPYKSHTLTTPTDLILCGIGNAQDTLDLMTGKVTMAVSEEIIFDGSDDEGWKMIGGVIGDSIRFCSAKGTLPFAIKGWTNATTVKCDKLVATSNTAWSGSFDCIYQAGEQNIAITKSKDTTLNDFKEWLQQNPITVQYKLAESVVKTIDLKGEKVYSYDGITRYTCTSKENHPAPILSIGIPTNLSAMVVKQKTMIQNLEKENQMLSNELQLSIASSNEVDNDLLAQSFELDFRLMEIEFALNLPMSSAFQLESRTSAMTPYDMAKKLILAKNYNRADMKYKLNVYVDKKRMTETDHQELLQLMSQNEAVIAIDSKRDED